MLDTFGTVAFDVRHRIEGRDVLSPDPILAAHDSLIAQGRLCEQGFTIIRFTVEDVPPVLTYEARIRCR